MSIPTRVVFCVVALSSLAAGLSPARADKCADFRTQMATVLTALDRAEAEEARVGRIQRPPGTDALLCAAVNKAVHEGHLGQMAADKTCFDNETKYNQFNTSLDSAISRHSKIAGLYHCGH
jgi:hypothetical protein